MPTFSTTPPDQTLPSAWDLWESRTPGRFARHVTRNLREKWLLMPHLELMDRMIVQAIKDAKTAATPPILVIEAPPRHGKSELISRYLPAWYLGTHPDHRVLFATNTDKLAKRYGRLARNLMDEWGQKLFGIRLAADSQAQNEWNIEGREGGYFSTSVGGRISGRGANCFPGETLIRTEAGDVSIEALFTSPHPPRVLAFNHKNGRTEWRSITAAREAFTDELIEITTAAGRTFRATKEHPIWVAGKGYLAASQIAPGQRLLSLSAMRRPQAMVQQAVRELSGEGSGEEPRAHEVRDVRQADVPHQIADGGQSRRWTSPFVLLQKVFRDSLFEVAGEDLSSLREDNARKPCPAVLFSGMPNSHGRAQVRFLRQVVQNSKICFQEVAAAWIQGPLLLLKMLVCPPRNQKCRTLSDVPEAHAWESPTSVLRSRLQERGEENCGCEEKKTHGSQLRSLWDTVPSQNQSNAVLFASMRKPVPFETNARDREFSLQNRHELCRVVQEDAASYSPARPSLHSVLCSEHQDETDLARKAEDVFESGRPSHRRETAEQSGRQSDPALREVPQGAPQLEEDTVAVVRRIRCRRQPVYDIQVEGCRNFFAEGVLAHNCLIVDDLIGKAEDALSETMRDNIWTSWQADWFRRLEPRPFVIVVSTRWHTDDLIGRLLRDAETEDGMEVRRLRLPALAEDGDPLGRKPGEALWPARFSAEYLGKIRSSVSSPFWMALYQQNPCQHEGTEWPADYFAEHIWGDDWPNGSEFTSTAMAIDPAKGKSTGDYGAIAWAGVARGLVWVDAYVERVPLETLVSKAIEVSIPLRPLCVTVEGNGFQDLAMGLEFNRQYEIRKMAPLPLRMVENRANKEDRIRRLGPYFAQKKVRFRGTTGGRRLVQQLREFPLAEHDDGPDALEMLFGTFLWLRSPESQGQSWQTEHYET